LFSDCFSRQLQAAFQFNDGWPNTFSNLSIVKKNFVLNDRNCFTFSDVVKSADPNPIYEWDTRFQQHKSTLSWVLSRQTL